MKKIFYIIVAIAFAFGFTSCVVKDNPINKNEGVIMEENSKNKLEADLMREVCAENLEECELIEQLLILQRSKSLMQRRRGLKSEIEQRLVDFVKCNNNDNQRD